VRPGVKSKAVANDFGVAIHNFDERAAARRAERANVRFPGGDTGCQFFFRNKADELHVRLAAAIERRRRASNRRDFDEVTTFHKSSGQ